MDCLLAASYFVVLVTGRLKVVFVEQLFYFGFISLWFRNFTYHVGGNKSSNKWQYLAASFTRMIKFSSNGIQKQ